MRCFVFGTGRCGTAAVAVAFAHATNFTAAHESFCSLAWYPDGHIEVNPQLRVRMGDIIRNHPEALYVWLLRDCDLVAASYDRLDRGNWLDKWWSFAPSVRPTNRREAARIAVDRLLAQCQDAYAACPPDRRLMVDIASPAEWFPALWAALGCEGDLTAALASFGTPVNTSAQRGDA